jgi:uncharacterized protein with HEPN domain
MDKKDLNRLNHILDAANALFAECKESNPNIPWRKIIGMRNQLAILKAD